MPDRKTEKTNTFVVQILYHQNDTWQGTVKWVEQRREEKFRSSLELIGLLDEAMREQSPPGPQE